jgi:signal transduction histidine kinase
MRIKIDIQDEIIRERVSTLLSAAGHSIESAPEEPVGEGAAPDVIVASGELDGILAAVRDAEHAPALVALVRTESDGNALVAAGATGWVRLDDLDRLPHEAALCGEIARLRDLLARAESERGHADRVEGIGLLASGVAHDFNNIVMAIHGYAELAEPYVPEDSPARRHLLGIQRSAGRARELTTHLLSFVRRDPGTPRVTDLNLILPQISTVLRRLITENIELILLPRPGLSPVRMDEGQLEQVLVNLVANARDAMPDGGKITIRAGNVTIDEDFARRFVDVTPGPYVVLSVSDTGPGIPADILPHIFEPFFTTKESGKGTGLGLANCYRVLKEHGGDVRVFSEQGQGATFNLYLPRAVEEQEPSLRSDPAEPAAAPLPRGTETILIAEDEMLVRDFMVRALETQGYRILQAGNGSEALHVEAGFGEPIDLLVTDMVMPQIGGKQLAEQLLTRRPGIKVLYTSGYVDDSVVLDNALHRSEAFLHKPVSAANLVRKVRALLDG